MSKQSRCLPRHSLPGTGVRFSKMSTWTFPPPPPHLPAIILILLKLCGFDMTERSVQDVPAQTMQKDSHEVTRSYSFLAGGDAGQVRQWAGEREGVMGDPAAQGWMGMSKGSGLSR